jgi:hypothetical protein
VRILLVIIAIAAIAGYFYNRGASPKKYAIAMAQHLVQTLADNQLSPELQACCQLPGTADEGAQALEAAREDLSEAGLDWATAQPMALGGTWASVTHPDGDGERTLAMVAWLYLADQGAHYGLELSARKDESRFIVTRVWRIAQLTLAPQDHARQAHDSFISEESSPPIQGAIEAPQFFYLPL